MPSSLRDRLPHGVLPISFGQFKVLSVGWDDFYLAIIPLHLMMASRYPGHISDRYRFLDLVRISRFHTQLILYLHFAILQMIGLGAEEVLTLCFVNV